MFEWITHCKYFKSSKQHEIVCTPLWSSQLTLHFKFCVCISSVFDLTEMLLLTDTHAGVNLYG